MADFPVRKMVLEVLSSGEEGTLTELHQKTVSRFHSRHSIQATKKALQALVGEKVLERNKLHYFFSTDWVVREKAFLDRILSEKSRRKQAQVDYSADHTVLFFETLFELDNFWNMAILRIAGQSQRKKWLALDHFLWFLIINIGFETSLVKDLQKHGFQCQVGANKAYRINQWGLGVYRQLGVQSFSLSEKDLSEGIDFNVIGDHILEIHYDKAVFKKIAKIFRQYGQIQQIPPKIISQLSTMKGKHEFRIIKSPLLAGQLFSKYAGQQLV